MGRTACQGKDVCPEEVGRDYPELVEPLREAIQALRGTSWLEKPLSEEPTPPPTTSESVPAVKLPCDFGPYVLIEQIGAGGMGQVFKALHRRMDRIVALKLLPEASVQDAGALERFQREARSAARLTHPNIATAYDAGEHEGKPYLVMEYVGGCDLQQHVQRHGPLPVEGAVDYVLQAARGLAYAHRQGVVHGDIKPANLILNPEGTVKILDLGLARLHAEGSSRKSGWHCGLPGPRAGRRPWHRRRTGRPLRPRLHATLPPHRHADLRRPNGHRQTPGRPGAANPAPTA